MKFPRLIFSTFVLLFGFSLVLFSAFKLSRGVAAMDTKGTGAAIGQARSNPSTTLGTGRGTESAEVAEGTEKATGSVDYYLPYPGILPDHPLYWLKMVRDRIRLWLTRDAEARFERLLLYADKRVGAAKALIEGGQADLGVATATKSEKYLEQAVGQFEKVKEAGKAYPERVEHLEKALAKHEEVLRGVKEKVPDQAKTVVDQAIEKAVKQRGRLIEKFRERERTGSQKKVQEQVQTQEQNQVQEGEMEQEN